MGGRRGVGKATEGGGRTQAAAGAGVDLAHARTATPAAVGSGRNSGSGWKNRRIAAWASRIYFLLVFLQIPLFRVPCRSGICTTPIQVTSSQLVANEIFPSSVVKTMLYPGAVANSIVTGTAFPIWGNLFELYNLTNAKNVSAGVDLQYIEILAGSYFCVSGALIGVLNPGRMSLFGTLLVVWGLMKEGLFGKSANKETPSTIHVLPTILIAIVCSFASVTYNTKKVARSTQPVYIEKPLQSSSKSKLK